MGARSGRQNTINLRKKTDNLILSKKETIMKTRD